MSSRSVASTMETSTESSTGSSTASIPSQDQEMDSEKLADNSSGAVQQKDASGNPKKMLRQRLITDFFRSTIQRPALIPENFEQWSQGSGSPALSIEYFEQWSQESKWPEFSPHPESDDAIGINVELTPESSPHPESNDVIGMNVEFSPESCPPSPASFWAKSSQYFGMVRERSPVASPPQKPSCSFWTDSPRKEPRPSAHFRPFVPFEDTDDEDPKSKPMEDKEQTDEEYTPDDDSEGELTI